MVDKQVSFLVWDKMRDSIWDQVQAQVSEEVQSLVSHNFSDKVASKVRIRVLGNIVGAVGESIYN